MVEYLHRQCKAALTARQDRERLVGHLPVVLLQLRSSFKEDLGYTTTELV